MAFCGHQSVVLCDLDDKLDGDRQSARLRAMEDPETRPDTLRARHRRTYKDLTRNIKCTYSGCTRVYASESSLQVAAIDDHGIEDHVNG